MFLRDVRIQSWRSNIQQESNNIESAYNVFFLRRMGVSNHKMVVYWVSNGNIMVYICIVMGVSLTRGARKMDGL